MTSAFSFRQRVGKLDWKLISSINLEDVILNMKISDLQGVLDEVTFCDFSAVDVKGNTVDSISKLVQLMQLICEYLLHSQEAQFKLIKDINSKSSKLKAHVDKLKHENVSLKEDCKIYQRQLAMLRKSLSKSGPNTDPWTESGTAANDTWNNSSPVLVDTLLQHERDTRSHMLNLLEEQRRTFTAEMSALAEALSKGRSSGAECVSPGQWMNTFKEQMERICESAIREMTKQVSGSQSRNRNGHSSSTESKGFDADTDYHSEGGRIKDILRASALEAQETSLHKRQQELVDRERRLQARELEAARLLDAAALQQQQQRQKTDQTHPGGVSSTVPEEQSQQQSTRADHSGPNVAVLVAVERSKRLALRALEAKIQQNSYRGRSRAFHMWVAATLQSREREQQDVQTRILTVSSRKLAQREAELRAALDNERNSVLEAQKTHRALQQELDQCREQLSNKGLGASAGSGAPGKGGAVGGIQQDSELVLAQQLQAEREKAVVAAAKHNIAVQRAEKERREMAELLRATEDKLAKELADRERALAAAKPATRETGVDMRRSVQQIQTSSASMATSTDFGALRSSVAFLRPVNALSRSTQQHLMHLTGDELSSEDLLERARLRIISKKEMAREAAESQAMMSLAQEIEAKMKFTSF